ncbi:MAG TPA: class I SAM-dependent methyltransferase [Chitinophagaceae bacterium]|nr:class I SAM-dependent methyltransferase [Chitinophagaceae bacterium]
MIALKHLLYKYLANNKVGKLLLNLNFNSRFTDTAHYWEKRYRNKGTSGPGSYGNPALYKSGILNKFVAENEIEKVIEFGCGDGNQLKLFHFPSYIGLDVSKTAIEKCIAIFKNDASKCFFLYNPKRFDNESANFKACLCLSLDVIYHLLEDDVFEMYMQHLFRSSTNFVIIYAWDVDGKKNLHVRHRKFTRWTEENIKEWSLVQTIENKSNDPLCDFFIYKKNDTGIN